MISYEPLAKYLKKRGKSIKDLQEDLGMKGGGLKVSLNSGRYISLGMIDRICERYGCRVEDVIKFEKGAQVVMKPNYYIDIDWDKLEVEIAGRGEDFESAAQDIGKSREYYKQMRRRGKIRKTVLSELCTRYGIDIATVKR